MGLLLSGIVDGQSYEDKIISADQAMKMFKIKESIEKLGSAIRFDLCENKFKKAPNGEMQHPQQQAIMCTLNGTYNGDNFQLTYYEKRIPRKDKGITYYENAPKKIYFQGVTYPVNMEKNKELGVFLFLHHCCETSPVKREGEMVVFKVHDHVAIAEAKNKKTTLVFNLYSAIMSEKSVETMRIKCQGMKLGGNIKRMTLEELKSALIDRMNTLNNKGQLNKFIEEYNSPQSVFTGLMYEAVSRGILTQVPDKGSFVYKWGEGCQNAGKVAHRVEKGKHPMEDLIQYGVNNYEYFLKVIEAELARANDANHFQSLVEKVKKNWSNRIMDENEDLEQVVAADVASMSISEVVEFSANANFIECNKIDSNVYVLKNDEIDGPALFKATDRKKWKDELVTYLLDGDNEKVLKTLRSKIRGKLNFAAKNEAATA